MLEREPIHLVLADVNLSRGGSGVEVARVASERDIPVLFLTAMTQTEDEARGFQVGAADFIQKPINPMVLQARVRTHLQVKAYQDELRDRNAWLQDELGQRLQQVDLLRDATLHVMISFAEFRDEDTGFLVRRTRVYVRTLALWLAEGAEEPLPSLSRLRFSTKQTPPWRR